MLRVLAPLLVVRSQARALCVALALVGCAATPPKSPDDEDAPSAARSSDPAYRADIQLICDVDGLAQVDSRDPLEAPRQRDAYWLDHVTQPDAIYFLTVFRSKADAERLSMLTDEAALLKLPRCPLVAALQSGA